MTNSYLFRMSSVIAGLLLVLALAACAAPAAPTTEATSLNLTDTTWKLESVNNVPASSDQEAILFFSGQGGVLGFTGCNIVNGNYQTSGSSVDITVNVVTSFTCPEALTVQEEALVQTITKASSAQMAAEKLTLSNPDDSLTAVFSLMPPIGISGTSWKLSAFNNGQGAFVTVLEGTEISANFGEDGSLSGSAGCNNYTTQYEVDGSSITIGMAASTMMMCSDPAGIMEQEAQYLASLPKATKFVSLGVILYLADDQYLPVAYYLSAQP